MFYLFIWLFGSFVSLSIGLSVPMLCQGCCMLASGKISG